MHSVYTIHDVSRADRTILAQRILRSSGDLRVELEDLLHAPLTSPLTLAWLQARLAAVPPAVLLGCILALDAADELLTSSTDIDFDTDIDADGWDFLDRDDYAAEYDADGADDNHFDLYTESTMTSSRCTCGGGGAYGGGSARPCGACSRPSLTVIEPDACPDCYGTGNADGGPAGTWDRDFGPSKPPACPSCQGTGEAAVRGAILAVEALGDFLTLRRLGGAA